MEDVTVHAFILALMVVSAASGATFMGEPPRTNPEMDLSLGGSAASEELYEDEILPLDYDHHLPDMSDLLPSPLMWDGIRAPVTDFPPSVPRFGVDCYHCRGVSECVLNGAPSFCAGGLACYAQYATGRRQVVTERGCAFNPQEFVSECRPTPNGNSVKCFCKSAPRDLTLLNANFTGGRAMCNGVPVRYIFGRETFCYSCHSADQCQKQTLVQCGAKMGESFMPDGCLTEFLDATLEYPSLKTCADMPSSQYIHGECNFQNNTRTYRCYCRGAFCNRRRTNGADSPLGFVNYVVKGLFEALSLIL